MNAEEAYQAALKQAKDDPLFDSNMKDCRWFIKASVSDGLFTTNCQWIGEYNQTVLINEGYTLKSIRDPEYRNDPHAKISVKWSKLNKPNKLDE